MYAAAPDALIQNTLNQGWLTADEIVRLEDNPSIGN